jgi:hypothetical protein
MSGWAVPEQFVIYGPTESVWSGPRWLSMADDGGDEGRGGTIVLDHGSDPWLFSRTDPWLSVASTNDTTATTDHDWARFGLIILMGSDDKPHYSPFNLQSWIWAGRNRVKPLLDRLDSWERVTWEVDGEPVDARVTEFTSAVVGVATVKPGAAVLVLSSGVEPHDLRLETQTDSTRYHFDRTQPVTEDTCDRARREALGDSQVDSGPPSDLPPHADLIPDST